MRKARYFFFLKAESKEQRLLSMHVVNAFYDSLQHDGRLIEVIVPYEVHPFDDYYPEKLIQYVRGMFEECGRECMYITHNEI